MIIVKHIRKRGMKKRYKRLLVSSCNCCVEHKLYERWKHNAIAKTDLKREMRAWGDEHSAD